MELVKGQTFKLSTDKAYMEKGNAQIVYVDYDNITKVLKAGNRVFVDDGLISLIVTSVSEFRSTLFLQIKLLPRVKKNVCISFLASSIRRLEPK